MSARYRNPWHTPGKPEYGPPEYTTGVKPTEYRGYLIYQRISGHVWDVVKDGVCITQRAGINGAKSYVKTLAFVEQTLDAVRKESKS